MDQPFNSRLKLDERSELGDARHGAANALAHVVLSGHCIPGMRLQLLHADGNAPLVRISRNLQHFRFDLLAYGKHVRRFVHAAPGNVTHVQQCIHSAEIDESAVIGETADRAAHGVAFLHLRIAAFVGRALFLFERRRGGPLQRLRRPRRA